MRPHEQPNEPPPARDRERLAVSRGVIAAWLLVLILVVGLAAAFVDVGIL